MSPSTGTRAVVVPLAGGGRVVACRRGAHGMAELRASLRADPTTPEANMVLARLLLGASAARSLRTLGAEASVVVDVDRVLLALSAPVDGLAGALAVVTGRLAAPRLEARDVALEQARLGALLDLAGADPAVAADAAANAALYGDAHPYGREPRGDVLAGLRLDDVQDVVTRTCRGGATVVVVGDAPAESLADVVVASGLGAGAADAPPLPAVPAPPPARAARRDVVLPGAVRDQLRVLCPAPPPGAADLPAVEALTTTVGGATTSLLFARLREQLGLTYRVRAQLVHAAAASAVVLSASSAPGRGTAVLAETAATLDTVVATPPRAEDLERVVASAIGRHRIATSTPAGLADALLAAAPAGDDPAAVVAAHDDALRRLAPADVVAAAARHLAADRRVLVRVTGDAAGR